MVNMATVARLLLLSALFVLHPRLAHACSCAGPTLPCDATWRADAVFIGRVTELGPGDLANTSVRFVIERWVHGATTSEMVLENGPGNCSLPFTLGDRYIVYAYRNLQTGMLTTSMCTRTRRVDDPRAREDVAYFDELSQTRSGAPLTGIVARVALDLTTGRFATTPLGGVRISIRSVSPPG